MQEFKIKDEYIKLGQLLKAAGLVSSGVDAKMMILEGKVLVNGQKEFQRGKKLRDGDIVEFDGSSVKVCG